MIDMDSNIPSTYTVAGIDMTGLSTSGTYKFDGGNLLGDIVINATHRIAFDGNGTHYVSYTGSVFQYADGDTTLFTISDSGAATVQNGINLVAGALSISSGTYWVAPSNCGSLASATKCLIIVDPNGNNMYIPAYGTY